MQSNADPQESDTDHAPFPRWLRDKERELWLRRRKRAACAPGPARYVAEDNRVGVALSGGGVRSATFCLGVVRALASVGLLRRVDYLSTVSGGGYTGAFLGALYLTTRRRNKAETIDGVAAEYVDKTLTATPDARPVRWLRDNGRYLAPAGTGTTWTAIAVLLRNWIALQLALMLAALTCANVALISKAACIRVALHYGSGLDRIAPTVAPLWASPLFLVSTAILMLFTCPSATAYWFIVTPRAAPLRNLPRRKILYVVGGAAGIVIGLWALGRRTFAVDVVLLIWTSVALAFWLAVRGWRRDNSGWRRFEATRWTTTSLKLSLAIFCLAVVDSLGQTLYAYIGAHRFRAVVWAASAALTAATPVVASAGRILGALGGTRETPFVRSPIVRTWGVNAAAVVAATSLGAFVSVVAHRLAWEGRLPRYVVEMTNAQHPNIQPDEMFGMITLPYGLEFLCVAAAALVIGQFHVFVYGSSLASFYATRLTRAYLGAANPRRIDAAAGSDESPFSRTEPVAGDRLSLRDYVPHDEGGPLHLINVTLNETFDARSKLLEPDRGGLPMALGPASLSVGVHHHAKRLPTHEATMRLKGVAKGSEDGAFRVFPPGRIVKSERLDVGEWVALSGAAVAPGLGPQTRIARSFLLSLFNLRLGSWWDSGIDPTARPGQGSTPLAGGIIAAFFERVTPAYVSFFDEALARFPGTARRHWYLSDGGHFENTACYELVRRRLPLIVCCDAGADPDYTFEDVGNLVRRVRIDFGADITFLDDDALTSFLAPSIRPLFGDLEAIRAAAATGQRGKCVYAALAHVRYAYDAAWPDGPRAGLLVLIKPVVADRGSPDVRAYQSVHPAFPQESTADQFFDDSQWEAYRRLGEVLAEGLFKSPSGERGWSPSTMRYSAPA